ncbi:MAG TPA: twin-arginine translocase TatA/TatE family subunit [Mariniflexile sp.]
MFEFIRNISPIELGAVLLILIALFGAKIVVNMAKTGGQTFKEMKNIKKTFTEAVEDDNDKPTKTNKEEPK